MDTVPPNEILPENYFAPLDLARIFPDPPGPLHVDLGCGEGTFLLEMARSHPGERFLGIERLLGRVKKCCRAALRQNLPNLRLLRIESGYAIRYLLPPETVSVFHFYCPDPWPKRRHWPKRLFTPDFLDAASTALLPGGELRIKTDNRDYFRWMQKIWVDHPAFAERPWNPPPDYPATDFESAFLARGFPIYRALLVKSLPLKKPSTA